MLPACAGMIPSARYAPVSKRSAPRMRGDDPSADQMAAFCNKCSPHARG
ncbi:hypothetical protein HMPREF1155_1420 [Slackia sp. CM382]|nr:hypothetical protein HMPREF1155_1420 [Slackia sp. CM382]